MELPNLLAFVSESLRKNHFSYHECLQAIHGKGLPSSLGNRFSRYCTIRGIRYHAAFATIARVLHGLPEFPEFTRALNARSIMSNIIPDMKKPSEIPYCIWHPNLASENTYRSLAARYPQIRYQVGRACAVAGYTNLYLELNLLPEVAIAEEARDNSTNGRPIFDAIMAHQTRYLVMDDYTRSVNIENPLPGACLNADTATRSSLEARQQLPREPKDYSLQNSGYRYFNITED